MERSVASGFVVRQAPDVDRRDRGEADEFSKTVTLGNLVCSPNTAI